MTCQWATRLRMNLYLFWIIIIIKGVEEQGTIMMELGSNRLIRPLII